ncbi:MAG TPA: hypothetical protein VGL07_06375 [Buttiauxella sp.]|jgi:hypothetical protein
MKKLIIATVLSLGTVSSAWAMETAMPAAKHQQAIPMNNDNGSADAHQQVADQYNDMIGAQTSANAKMSAKPFAEMNEHEQAAIALSFTKNGQSGPHQRESKKHLSMMATD